MSVAVFTNLLQIIESVPLNVLLNVYNQFKGFNSQRFGNGDEVEEGPGLPVEDAFRDVPLLAEFLPCQLVVDDAVDIKEKSADGTNAMFSFKVQNSPASHGDTLMGILV